MVSVIIKKLRSEYSDSDAKELFKKIKSCGADASLLFYAERIMKKKDPSARARSLIALLTLIELCASADIAAPDVKISVSEGGRPNLIFPECADFNVSHTSTLVATALALGHGARVGIDVEDGSRTVGKRDTIENIANRFFSKNELEYLKNGNGSKKERFLELWTKKEAYLKYTGDGIGKMSETDTLAPTSESVDFLCEKIDLDSNTAYFTLCYRAVDGIPEIKLANE